ncbi:MAG: hypothetical protein ABIJ16_07085, partial [Bacteroidota bacterium]
NLYNIYYTKGLEALTQGKTETAKMFFNKSINANLMFAPAHYQLAKIDYHEKNYESSVQRIKDILSKMQPDPNTYNMTVELAKAVYNDNISEAVSFNNKTYYEQALTKLKFAESVCISVPGVLCDEKLKAAYGIAYNGKIKEYCDKAGKAMVAGAFPDAESLIETAVIIQNTSSSYTGPELIQETYKKLYDAYISHAIESAKAGQYDKALEQYNGAGYLCTRHNYISCTDQLDKGIAEAKTGLYNSLLNEADKLVKNNDPENARTKLDEAIKYRNENNLQASPSEETISSNIQFARYTISISKGKEAVNRKDYALALKYFDEAYTLEGTAIFKKDASLSGSTKNAARALFFMHIQSGNENVNGNNLSVARSHYKSANELQEKYGLVGDKDVNSALAGLKDKIFSQECRNAQALYDQQYNEGMGFVQKASYIEADDKFNMALKTASDNADCGIDTKAVNSKKQEIYAGVTYQKKLQEIGKLLDIGKFDEVIEKYIEAEIYFNGNYVSSLRLQHTPLYDYIKKGRDRFVNHGTGYYTRMKDFDKALGLLDELKSRDYHCSFTKDNQLLLGTNLALRDHRQNPQAVAKTMVINYTKGDKWFKYLKKGYLTQWKKL